MLIWYCKVCDFAGDSQSLEIEIAKPADNHDEIVPVCTCPKCGSVKVGSTDVEGDEVGVIWFNYPLALGELERTGVVYTLRPKRKSDVRHAVLTRLRDKRCIGHATIKFIKEVKKGTDLKDYVKMSGYSTIEGWWSAAKGSMYLHRVEMIENGQGLNGLVA